MSEGINLTPHAQQQLRAQLLKTLTVLVERYPNLRVGQIIANAVLGTDFYNVTDEQLAAALVHLFASFTQLESAGLKPGR